MLTAYFIENVHGYYNQKSVGEGRADDGNRLKSFDPFVEKKFWLIRVLHVKHNMLRFLEILFSKYR